MFSCPPLSRAVNVFSACVLLILLSSFARTSADAASQGTYAFTVLGPEGAVARVITADAQCPAILIDGNQAAMRIRAAPDQDFPITVCDAAIPLDARTASILGQELKLPKVKPERVVVLGDTGCRLKGDTIQACNDPAQWPLAQIAETAADTNPDLVIHVGDYHYRESACPADNVGCAGSPYGDNWASWEADLFAPARALLQAAPWAIVRGNHEDCSRAGGGYFRLLDSRPLPASCPTYTEPYAIAYVEPRLLILDNSAVNDYQIEPEQVAAYAPQLETMNALADENAWWLQHDPMYAFGHAGEQDGQEQLFQDQLTLQQAGNNSYAPGVKAFISGHIHLFEVLTFGQDRPPQLLVGNSGTLLDPPVTTPLAGLEIAGMKVAYGTTIDKFGFVAMERSGDTWTLAVKDVNGGDMGRCVLGGAALLCGRTVPQTGTDFETQHRQWLLVALFGGAMLCAGLELARRGRPRGTR